jgi:hypothetical protein
MSTVSGKSKPKRAMRVATIFTGVAAATVGVTQAANAQDVAHAVAKPTLRHTERAIRPAGRRIDGSIQYYVSCGNAGVHPTWLHVSTNTSGGYGPQGISVCFGFKGIYSSPPGTGMNAECGGNNYGYINGSNNGDIVSDHFGPGTGYRAIKWSHYDDILITSWAGNDQCKRAPYWHQPTG